MQDELGMDQDDDELAELRERASRKEWSEETGKAFEEGNEASDALQHELA